MEKRRLHISAGRGPAECTWVVAQVVAAVLKMAQQEGASGTVIQRHEGSMPRSLDSAIVELKGSNLESMVKAWTGSILWVGQSPYRKMHKRKNWFVEVNELAISKNEKLSYADIQFQATKSSGPGGQHVNKTMSAVRATHVPSGISVLVQDSRSQHQNKKIAVERLNDMFEKKNVKANENLNAEQWKLTIDIQRGNPIRVYEGRKFRLRG